MAGLSWQFKQHSALCVLSVNDINGAVPLEAVTEA